VKDPSLLMKDYVTQVIAKTGENVVVKRFVRFQLGEEA
jgi:elongation factor Ts